MLFIKNTLVFVFLFITWNSNSQTAVLSRIDSLSGALVSKIRSEKTEQSYISTDKSIYKAGETIWFRVFLLNTATQKLSARSQTLFVELVNEKNKVLSQLLLHAGVPQPGGRLLLPDTISTGYYWLRAYTKNMQSQGNGSFQDQPVYIYNPNNKNPEQKKNSGPSSTGDLPSLHFYPEGGIMITGAPSVVAVRLEDKNGKPISGSGIIKDSRNLLTTDFKTDEYGLGKFQFEPFHRMKYVSSVKWRGKEYIYPLPAFNFFAGQIAVSSQKDGSKKVRVLLEDSIFNGDPQTYLIGVSKDSVCFASIGGGNYELNIPAGKLPPGISTFFLFDRNMKLLSERSAYIKEGLTVKAELDKNMYSKGDRATVNISIVNSGGRPEVASFSVSVTDAHLIKPLEKDRVNPGDWSLAEDNDLNDEEADLLMLTKNNIYEKLTTYQATTLPVSNSDSIFYIHGSLKDKDDNPLAGKVISLFSKTQNDFFETDTTDDRGRFSFHLTGYPDSTIFTLQALNNTDKPEGWKTEIDPVKFSRISAFTIARKFDMEPNYVASYLDSFYAENKKIMLQPVEIKKGMQDDPGYDKTKRVSPFSHIVPGKNIQEGNGGVGNALFQVPGVKLLNGYLVFGGATKFSGIDATSEPMIIVNGIEATVSSEGSFASPALNYLNGLDVHTIDFIEVLSGPEAANYGLKGGNGVILVNTTDNYRQKNGESKNNTLKTFFARGYQVTPLFPTRVNDAKKQNMPPAPDVRSTVYWNGNIITDNAGKAAITFYTNDVPGKYTGTIKGITEHGYVIYKTFTYEVQ